MDEKWHQSGSAILCPNVSWVCIMAEPHSDRPEPIGITSPGWDEAMRRAHLVTAAPEMYEALGEAIEAVIWMSGSSDFSPEGTAHEGWLKVHPRIGQWKAALARARGEIE